jgi:hypothetical protein
MGIENAHEIYHGWQSRPTDGERLEWGVHIAFDSLRSSFAVKIFYRTTNEARNEWDGE